MLNVIAGLLSGGAAPAAATSYESIATVTVGAGGASSAVFSSIPNTYKHLQIRFIAQGSTSADCNMTFNSDTTNYYAHIMRGGSTSVVGQAYAISAITNLSTSWWNVGITDILDYTSTNKNKTSRTLTGYDFNSSTDGNVGLWSQLWYGTPAAISTITLTPTSGSFAQNSKFALYGIKG